MLESSFMLLIPGAEETIQNPEALLGNLEKSGEIKVLSHSVETPQDAEENDMVFFKVNLTVQGREHEIILYPYDVMIPDYIRVQHVFTDEEAAKVREAQVGLAVEMQYGKDVLQDYQDQLKILVALDPNLLAVMDVSAEKILCGSWVILAAKSQVLPPPRYLFSAQAITGDSDEVWIHTHGLGRCGFTELEVLGSDRENYSNHYTILETLAYRMIEKSHSIEEGESIFLAWLDETTPLSATVLDWSKAMEYYPGITVGTYEDRSDPYHSEGTAAIMLYMSEEDEENGKMSPVSAANEYLKENPLFMISDAETMRMSKMARERIQYALKAIREEQNHVILKLGLVVDPQYRNPNRNLNTQKEHIWFELLDVQGEKFHCVATQDAYYIDGLVEGTEGDYSITDVTDWIIYTPDRRYYPDDAYALIRLKTYEE